LKVVTSADLGGLGAKEGPPAGFVWTVPNLLLVLPPWLAVVALLVLRSNRNPRAWLVWVPPAALALAGAVLKTPLDTQPDPRLGYSFYDGFHEACAAMLSHPAHVVGAAAFGLAAIWLVGTGLARRRRALSIVLMALAFGAVSLLALQTRPVWEQVWGLYPWESDLALNVLVFWVGSGIVYAGALNLTGWMCRRGFSGVRVSLGLLLWLWAMWVAAAVLVRVAPALFFGGSFNLLALLWGTIFLSLACFALMLPFLILSFTNSFYRERLKSLLRLPGTESAPAAPAPPPVAGQRSPQ